jgi:DNA-binding CsgD family transcriptional regulator
MTGAEVDRVSGVIDSIYAAALDRSLWPQMVDELRKAYRCRAAGFYVADHAHGTVDLLGMHGIDNDQIRVYVDRFLCDNPWTHVPALQREGVLRTERSLDEYHRNPGYYRSTVLFNEWMRPQDFIHTLGVNVVCDHETQVKLFAYRAHCEGTYEGRDAAEFCRLVPHLRNAINVARRFELLNARLDAVHDVLDRIPVGVMFLDQAGMLVQANRSAAELFEAGSVFRLEGGVIHARRPFEARRLSRLIHAALRGWRDIEDAPAALEILRSGRRPLSVTAIPLTRYRDGRWFSPRLAAALVVSDPDAEPLLTADWLRRRYGLTQREAQITQSLVAGLTLRGAAEIHEVSYETARWYLKQVFQKTGVSRQSELIRLLVSERIL